MRVCLSSRANGEIPGNRLKKVAHRISRLRWGTRQFDREPMTKDSAIAYWLVPETAARDLLSREIAELAKQFNAPLFEPHVTVFVAPENSVSPNQVVREAGNIDIELTIHGIQFGEQFTRTLFVQFGFSEELQQLGDLIWRASGALVRYLVDPHLSLLYAKLPEETKQTLADKIRLPFGKIRFTSIRAMRCARPTTAAAEIERWKLLAP